MSTLTGLEGVALQALVEVDCEHAEGLKMLPLKLRVKLQLRGVIYTARHIGLRARGYRTTNPVCRNWENYPPSKMRGALEFIFEQANIRLAVDTLIDHACGNGHYANELRKYARRLIGVDILPPESVSGYDRYIQAPTRLMPSYLDDFADGSVDLVLVVGSTGMHVDGKHDAAPHCGDWQDYFSKTTERQGRYLTPNNYPRVLKPGGYLVIQEWEAYPVRRVGRIAPDEVARRIDEFYPHSEIPGFTMVAKGISPYRIGPYIVYRKD